MRATDYLNARGIKVSPNVMVTPYAWAVVFPDGWGLDMSIQEVEEIALDYGWTYPADENGWMTARGKAPCEACGYRPGAMNMYTNGERIVCAKCRPENALDRHNRRAFFACEASYLEDTRG